MGMNKLHTTVLSLLLASSAALAAPGVPSDPVVVWKEDFQYLPGPLAAADYIPLSAYSGATPLGQKYTSDFAWSAESNHCNGLLSAFKMNQNSINSIARCSNKSSWNVTQNLAYAFSVYRNGLDPANPGAEDPNGNYALTAYTQGGDPGAGKVQFQTSSNIPLLGSTRFLMTSIETAAVNCVGFSHPLLRFYLLGASGEAIPLSSTNQDACLGGKTVSTPNASVQVNTISSSLAVMYTGSNVGYMMRNFQSSSSGNDAAIDNPKILDVTPAFDKAFVPASISYGKQSVLTFTITNTTDLAAKNGWSFTDQLASSLVVAASPAISTTCGAGTNLVAPVGGNVVTVTNGQLPLGAASCTVSVPVLAAGVGSYENGSNNMTSMTFLNAPSSTATLTVVPDAILSSTTQVPANVTAGSPMTVSGTCTNSGPSEAVAPTCTLGNLPPGATQSCLPNPAPNPLGVNSSITCTSTFPAPASGAVTITTQAGSSTGSSNTANNNSSATVPVTPVSDMVSTVSGFPASATAGTPINGTVTCQNNGPSATLNASCAVSVPSGATFSCNPSSPAPLAVGSSIVCNVSYTAPGNGVVSATVSGIAGSENMDPAPGNNQSQQGIGVVPQADMQAITTMPASATVGQPMTVSGVCTNNGPSTAQAPTCTLNGLPSGATQSCAPNPVPTLAVGGAITCTSTFNTPVTSAINITTSAASSTIDGNTSNNTHTGTTPITQSADLGVTISGLNPAPQAGSTESGTVTCTNAGPSVAVNASCTVGGSLPPGAQVNCGAPANLAVGASASCTVSYTVPASGSVALTATATSSTPDPVSSNNTANFSQTVTQVADMQASITAPATILANQPMTVTGICTNAGPSAAQQPTCTLAGLPAGAPQSCTPNPVPSALPVGASITCTSTFNAPANVTRLDFTANAGSTTTDTNSANNAAPAVTTVTPQADVSAVINVPGPVTAGQPFTATLTCANAGPSAAADFSCVANALPGSAITGQSCLPSPTPNPLPSGSSLICTVTGTAPANGELTLNGTAASATADPDTRNNHVQESIGVVLESDMQGTTTLPAGPFTAGKTITVSGTCTNAGPSDAAAASCALSGLPANAVQTCTPSPIPNPLLAASPSNTVTCTSTFALPATGTLHIATTATSSTKDPVTANNVDTKDIVIAEQADMQVTFSGFPTSAVQAGTEVTGVVACKNNGASIATAATCSLDMTLLPADATMTCAPGTPAASLADQASMICTVKFIAPGSGPVVLNATTGNSVTDPVADNNKASLSLDITAAADMQATVTLPASVQGGDSITVSASCVNNGPSDAAAPTCALTNLPAEATQSCVPTPMPTTLVKGAAAITCTSTFVVPKNGSLTIGATAGSTTPDPKASNNTDSKALVITPVSDMNVSFSGFPASVPIGGKVSGTVICKNDGPSTAANASCVVTALPAEAVVVCLPSSTVPTLASGDSIMCSVTYTRPNNSLDGLVISANTSSDSLDLKPENNSGSVKVGIPSTEVQPVPIPRGILLLLTLMMVGLGYLSFQRKAKM